MATKRADTDTVCEPEDTILMAERDLARYLAKARQLDEVARLCLDAAIARSGLECGGVYLQNRDSARLELACHVGLSDEFAEAEASVSPNSVRQNLLESGHAFEISRSRMEELDMAASIREGLSLIVALPVIYERGLVACLNLASRTTTSISREVCRVLETMAAQMGAAISRAQAEDAACESERRQKAILDTIPDPAWLKDKEGRFLAINAAWCRFFDLDVQAVVGKTAFELLPAQVAETLWEQDRRVMQSRQILHIEELLPDNEGRCVWFETIKNPLFDEQGAVAGITGIARNISARKQAEEALQQSEAKFKSMFFDSAIGMEAYDATGRLLQVNRACLDIFGVKDESELRGFNLFEDPNISESMKAEIQLGRTVRYEAPFDFEVVKERGLYETNKSGTIHLSVVISPTKVGPDDAVQNYLVQVDDVTDRKRAEQERLEMERRLLHAQKLESLGILAGGIAHDFNNILAGIMGYTELLKRSLPQGEAARADLDVIKKAVQRAADLTRQMLAYAGKGKFVVEAVDVSKIVGDARKMLEVSVSKKAALDFNLASDLPSIQADASQIHQVILNLVINASDSLGENSGKIAVSTDAIRLNGADGLAVYGNSRPSGGPCVRLTVADTGCGMDPETLGKIFDPFFTTKMAGRGLGLAAVHGIVRSHRGVVRVTSEPGKGTTFTVLFPTSDANVPASLAQSPSPSLAVGGRVLVVDDEETIRNIARRVLEGARFSVLSASDGEEAIRVFRQNRDAITCVVLDLAMPKMDGLEALQEIRRISPEVRVVLSSGYTAEGAADRFAGLGLAAFVQKPYQVETLLAAVGGTATQDKL